MLRMCKMMRDICQQTRSKIPPADLHNLSRDKPQFVRGTIARLTSVLFATSPHTGTVPRLLVRRVREVVRPHVVGTFRRTRSRHRLP